MTKVAILCFLTICFVYGFAQPIKEIPRITDVAKKFHETYAVNNEVNGYITFEKRREGWYVVSNKYEDYAFKPFKRELFYNIERQAYEQIEFESFDLPREFSLSDYVDDWFARYSDLHRYFGYRGWYVDVINELEGKNNLSDDELYSLARAYSTYAYNLFSNQGDDAILEKIWPLTFSVNCFSDRQVEIFAAAIERSQNAFKKLAERNPAYETMVGKIGIKYANEIVVKFHLLLTHAERHAYKMELPEHLYPDSLLQPLREALKDCPNSAILMSFGDNDFYPTLYLQQKEKLRQDVHLVNFSLLAIDQYIFRATKEQFRSPGVLISMDTNYYKNRTNEMILVESGDNPLELSQLRKLLETSHSNASKRVSIDAAYIQLANNNKPSTPIKLPLKNARYLLKNHWIILDIIENLGDRKLCLISPFFDELESLNENFEQKGKIWILK